MAVAVQLTPAKHLIGVDPMFARDQRYRGTRLQRFFHNRALEFQPVMSIRPAPCRRPRQFQIRVHNPLCGHKFERPIRARSSANDDAIDRRCWLDAYVLPRFSGIDQGHVEILAGSPSQQGPRHEFRAVVRAQDLRGAILSSFSWSEYPQAGQNVVSSSRRCDASKLLILATKLG